MVRHTMRKMVWRTIEISRKPPYPVEHLTLQEFMMKLKVSRIVGLVLVLMLLTPVVAIGQSPAQPLPPLPIITSEFAKLEPYVRITTDAGWQQVFDASAALRDGVSPEIVSLAQEIVAFQNALAQRAANANLPAVSVEQYPKVKELFDLASRKLRSSSGFKLAKPVAQASPPPCGNWTHPVPNSRPPDYGYGPYGDPAGTLRSWGFHDTAFYACYYINSCGNDFTRGRGYNGPYGYCEAPRFRDHGWHSGGGYVRIQYGEPNPEIFSYSWPYWNWGAYLSS